MNDKILLEIIEKTIKEQNSEPEKVDKLKIITTCYNINEAIPNTRKEYKQLVKNSFEYLGYTKS